MKRVLVNAYQVALVFENGVYRYMLREGKYWLWKKSVIVYELNRQFLPPVELIVLLKDETLAEALQVIDVRDNEIALKYENGLLKEVFGPGQYAFWKGMIDYRFVKADISKVAIDPEIDRSLLSGRILAPYVRSVTVESYENAVLFVNGAYKGVLESGVHYWWKNSIPVIAAKADTRRLQAEISGQEILTRDKAALRISAFAQYKVVDIEKALLKNKEYDKQLYVLLQLALREYVARLSFDELLEKKDSIGNFILNDVKHEAAALGVELASFGIRDIILPGDVKDIMNQVLVAEKKAQANTIMRREETASTRSLMNTAKLMEENAMLWKLKEMEYVEKIAEKIGTISVFGNSDLAAQLKQLFIAK
jgi:hypothetical protein